MDENKKKMYNIEQSYKNILANLDGKFSPFSVSFREKEENIIETFIEESFQIKKSSTKKQIYRFLLVSGLPGVGKTLCISNILRKYQENNKILQLNAMSINCKTSQIFKEIANMLKMKTSDLKSVKKEIEKLSNSFILLIDEFESLLDNYDLTDLFKLCSIKNFILIVISNKSEKVFSVVNKEKFKIEPKSLVFEPYQLEEMVKIIEERISCEQENLNKDIFEERSILLCAHKIYKQKGSDLRCLLEICKKTLLERVKRNDYENKVTVAELWECFRELHLKEEDEDILSSIPENQHILLLTLFLAYKKKQELKISEIFEKHNENCNNLKFPKIELSSLKEILMIFESYNVIDFKSNSQKKTKNNFGNNNLNDSNIVLKMKYDALQNFLEKNDLLSFYVSDLCNLNTKKIKN